MHHRRQKSKESLTFHLFTLPASTLVELQQDPRAFPESPINSLQGTAATRKAYMKEINASQHWLFQLANAFLFLSYASRDLLVLRIVLMLAGLCFVLWGSLSLTSIALDTILWNAIFCFINAVRSTELAWQRRPIQFDKSEHEIIYSEVFSQVGISRRHFKELIALSLFRSLREGSVYIEAGNKAVNLTLLYEGRMSIVSAPKDGRPKEMIGSVNRMQFIESPQWANLQVQRGKKANESAQAFNPLSRESLRAKSKYGPNVDIIQQAVQANENDSTDPPLKMDVLLDKDVRAASEVDVTFRAESDVSFFQWPIERLVDYLNKNPNVKAPINAVIGSDVATKLFSQSKSSEGNICIDRRVYLPLDEPQGEDGLIPFETDTIHGGNPEDTSEENEDETKGGKGADNEIIQPVSVRICRRNSLVAEKIWLEQRGIDDTQSDQELAKILSNLTALNKYEISALLSKGKWREIKQEGTVLVREGEPMTFLCIILEGSLSVYKGDCKLHNISPMQMVGSLELLEADTEHIAGETVIANGRTKYMSWDVDDLRATLAPRPRLRSQLTTLIAIDLAAKFRLVENMV